MKEGFSNPQKFFKNVRMINIIQSLAETEKWQATLQRTSHWTQQCFTYAQYYKTQIMLCRASLTSIPSLFKAYSSKFKMAILIVLGGGSTVRPILIALLLLESKTMISCLFPSAAVFLVIKQGESKINASSLVLSVFHD